MGSSSFSVPSVNLTKYVNLGNDQWRFCPVVTSSNGRIRPDYVLVNGKPELHKEGGYYVEWRDENRKRRRKAVGKDAADAHATQLRQAQLLAAKAHGIAVVEEKKGNRTTLADACTEFLEETRQQRKPATYKQYEVALRYFQESCGKDKRLGEIGRKDLLEFVRYMREEKRLTNRTVWTKLNVPVQLLNANGISGLMTKRDWPRFVQQEPDIYMPDELQTFFAACDPWKATLFQFFLMTGFREAEVKYVTWKDIDFKDKVVRVTAKPDMGFIPKTWEGREVPIPDPLVDLLQRHKATSQTQSRLVFPTSTGQVSHHFLEACKVTALEAGLNCGNCDNRDKTCAVAPVCDSWFLHKFRATFATMHLQNGTDLRTVQSWMGHRDLASTMRYLKPARGNAVRDRVNNAFNGVGV